MDDYSLSQFIDRLKEDESLRQRVLDAEGTAAATIKQGTVALEKIAADAGFDITGWSGRPGKGEPSPTSDELADYCCSFTCCILATSTLIIEDIT